MKGVDDDGMIVLHQPRPADKSADRVRIKKENVLMAYSSAASDLPAYPVYPQNGFGAQSPYGDWYMYNDWALCEQFKSAFDHVYVVVDGARVRLEVSIKKLTMDHTAEGKISKKMVDVLSVHVGVRIPNGPLFPHINGKVVKEAFEMLGFNVLKQNRSGVKFNGERIKDKGLGGDMFHVNIRPRDGDILGAFYPPQLEVKVKGTRQFLEYQIFDHPEIGQMLCYKTCHRYKAHAYEQLQAMGKVPHNWCICDQIEKSKPGPSRGAGGQSGAAAFLAALKAQKEAKGSSACKHFPLGKCYAVGGKGPRCAFLHEGDPTKITCALGAACKGPQRCGYLHSTEVDEDLL